MPVRSSVCTYSPSSVLNSKYSTVLPPPSSLSVGNYKPISSSSLSSRSSTTTLDRGYSSGSNSSANIGSSLRYGLSSSSYSPSSLSSQSYSSSTRSTLGYSQSSPGQYRALSSTYHEPISSSYTTNAAYTRYSSGSSTGSASSSSLSSASSSLLDRSYALTSNYPSSVSGYHYKPSSAISRRYSNTVSSLVDSLFVRAIIS